MTITNVNSATFLADTVNLLRNDLSINITDPIVTTRSASSKFVMTSYPKNKVEYPMITIVDAGISQQQRLGMQSESTSLTIPVEIRIWARNVVERDELFGAVYDWLRTNQFGGSTAFVDANLHDFTMTSAVNVNDEQTKSKVMEVQFLFICQ